MRFTFFRPREVIVPVPQARKVQPEPGGPVQHYRVAGIRLGDGGVSLLADASISIEGHDKTYRLSDSIPLTALEAAVLGKRYVLNRDAHSDTLTMMAN